MRTIDDFVEVVLHRLRISPLGKRGKAGLYRFALALLNCDPAAGIGYGPINSTGKNHTLAAWPQRSVCQL